MNPEIKSIQIKNISLLAGLPICIEKEDANICWDIKFKDKTKNYKVWLSYEPFDTNYDTFYGVPNEGLELVDVTSNGLTAKYAIIRNGEGTIEWNMKKDSPIYCKWAITNNAIPEVLTINGAVLDLKNCNQYELVKK